MTKKGFHKSRLGNLCSQERLAVCGKTTAILHESNEMQSNNQDIVSANTSAVPLYGCYEIAFKPEEVQSPQSPLPIIVTFTLPSKLTRTGRGYLESSGIAKARAYICEDGEWSWEAKNLQGRCIGTGQFLAKRKALPGKLRISRNDSRSFVYDNGNRFIRIGDTATRLLSPSEKNWKTYIDQAAQAGFNLLRVGFGPEEEDEMLRICRDGKNLNLTYWDEMDRRLIYALTRHPHIQIQISLFEKDEEEALKYADGDLVSNTWVRYAQERFSALPNVLWCIGDGLAKTTEDPNIPISSAIDRIGKDLLAGELWGTLITDVAERFGTIEGGSEPWRSFISISDLGQVTGEAILKQRALSDKPIVLESDRGERFHPPANPRYFFRRLFWGTLLSGGYSTYQGLETAKPHDGNSKGITGYYDACNSGKLRHGANDLLQIARFLEAQNLSLEGWIPDDHICGSNPLIAKSMRSQSGNECIAYIANPDSFDGHDPQGFEGNHTDAISHPSETFTTITLELRFSAGNAKWFCPSTGDWKGDAEITRNSTTLLTPAPGDWIIIARKA